MRSAAAFSLLLVFALATTGPAQSLVSDIAPGLAGSNPVLLRGFWDKLIFNASDGVNGEELWISDGTAAGTFMLKDITPGASSTGYADFHTIGTTHYFIAGDPTVAYQWWKTDGTTAGTVPITSFPSTANLIGGSTLWGATIFFGNNDGVTGYELWKTDGTAAGTVMVKDINPGAASSNLVSGTILNGLLVFRATTSANGVELWATDGTTAGTFLVKDIRTGSASSTPALLTAVGSTIFFTANNGVTGIELWKTDGTAAGTVLVKDIRPGSTSSNPSKLTAVGNTLFFRATDGVNGVELWKSDGTTAGTVMVTDIVAGSSGSNPDQLIESQGILYFTADGGPTTGIELWKSDGTAPGTVMIEDFSPGAPSGFGLSFPPLFEDTANTRILAAANDSFGGYELVLCDANGAVQLSDINPGLADSTPYNFTRVGSRVYFVADNGVTGGELWAIPLSTFGGALAEPFGNGCSGSNGVPQIATTGVPVIGNGGFGIQVTQGLPNAPASLFAHTLQQTLDLGGGCFFYLSLLPGLLELPTAIDGTGVATISAPLPVDFALVGFEVLTQWAVVDPNGWAGLVSLSQAMRIVIGVP